MKLEIDKKKMTIMDVKFDTREDFEAVWYAISSSMIEGWQPNPDFIETMKTRIVELRLGAALG